MTEKEARDTVSRLKNLHPSLADASIRTYGLSLDVICEWASATFFLLGIEAERQETDGLIKTLLEALKEHRMVANKLRGCDGLSDRSRHAAYDLYSLATDRAKDAIFEAESFLAARKSGE